MIPPPIADFCVHPASLIFINEKRSLTGTIDGLSSIYRGEGFSGLWRGTSMALVGVSSGALQFMAYEEMKKWGFSRLRKSVEARGEVYDESIAKLVC